MTGYNFVLLLLIFPCLMPPVLAQEERNQTDTGYSYTLPERQEILIRNATIITMDESLGIITDGDLHFNNGAIVAVGNSLDAPGATVLEGHHMIVLPGFIDTHWHMWNTLLRSMSGDRPEHGYFPMRTALGRVFDPEDNYLGVMLSAAEAINSGITSVNNWSHNIRSPQHAEQELRALEESGLRARFSYGPSTDRDWYQSIDLEHLQALNKNWNQWSAGGLITLGLAWRGPSPRMVTDDGNAGMIEFNLARRLKLPLSIHAGSRPDQTGEISLLAEKKYLGPDVLVIHATSATDEDIRALMTDGSPVSLSPFTEMRIGYGLPPVMRLLEAGVISSLAVDTAGLSGNADMFAIMKVIQNLANGMTRNEFTLTAQRVIQMATIDGARALELDDQTGSLTPGKRADLIMVSLDAVNLGVMTRPDHLIVEAAQPVNVDTVIIDGRILKRAGRLTALNINAIINDAAKRIEDLKRRADWHK